MNLRGKTALVTGASKRIGKVIALELASAGVHILLHYNRSAREAASLSRQIEKMGVSCRRAAFSFSPKDNVSSRIRKFTASLYKLSPMIDILVNNAAIFYPTPLAVKEKDWDEFLTVNLKYPFFLAQEIGLRMSKAGEGKIINLVDWTGQRPSADYIPYAISKAGLIAATQGLAKALAPRVQVNSIAPGPILPAAGHSARHHKQAAEKTVLKRYGSPEDIAKTVRYLCEATDYVTGAMIPVDGGGMIL